MRALVVGLVNRPQRPPLARALARRGHTLECCFSTDLIIEASLDAFSVRLKDRALDDFDVIVFWALKHRRWEWYLAAEDAMERAGISVVSNRAHDPDQPPSISWAWDRSRLDNAGIAGPKTLMYSDAGASFRLFKELKPPVVVRGMRGDYPSTGKVFESAEALHKDLDARSERAFMVSELVPASLAFRFLMMGGDVQATLKIPNRPKHGITPPAREMEALPIFDVHDRLAEVAVRAAEATGIDIFEIDIALREDGTPVVLTLNRNFERIAFEDYGESAYDAFAEHLEAVARNSNPRPSPKEATSPPKQEGHKTLKVKANIDATALSVLVWQQRSGQSIAAALNAARALGDFVVLGTPDQARASVDAQVNIPEGTNPPVAWSTLREAAQGSHFAWLLADDLLSVEDATQLRQAFDERAPEHQGLSTPYILLEDNYGWARHRLTVPRILPLGRNAKFRETGLYPKPEEAINTLIHKGISIRFFPPRGGYSKAIRAAVARLEHRLSHVEDLVTRVELGLLLMRDKRYQDAVDTLTPATDQLQGAERAKVLASLALAHLRLGDRDRCRLFARSAISEEPRLAEPRHILGDSYYEVRDFSAARRWLEEAHSLCEPEDIDVLYPYWYQWFTTDMLYCACDRLGDYRAGLTYLEEVEAKAPGSARVAKNRDRMTKALRRRSYRLGDLPETDTSNVADGRRLSVCIIVRNEGDHFHKCLEHLHILADEVVVVDTGSTDNSLDIARAYTAHTYTYPWQDDFAAARNFSFDQASGSHLMWLDSDDIISKENAELLRSHFLRLSPDVDAVRIPYIYRRDAAGRADLIQRRERIVKNEETLRFRYPIHEIIPVHGRHVVTWEDVQITHEQGDRDGEPRADRNLRILQNALATNTYSGDRHLTVHLATALAGQGRHAEAIPLFKSLLDSSDTARRRGRMAFRLAKSYLATGDLKAARRYAEVARVHQPGLREPLVVLGQVAKNEGDERQAIHWWERARRIAQGSEPIHLSWYRWEVEEYLAEAYLSVGDADSARRMIRELSQALGDAPRVVALRKRVGST